MHTYIYTDTHMSVYKHSNMHKTTYVKTHIFICNGNIEFALIRLVKQITTRCSIALNWSNKPSCFGTELLLYRASTSQVVCCGVEYHI